MSKQHSWRLYRLALVLNDALGIIVGFRLAYYVRFELALPIFMTDVIPTAPLYQAVVLVLIPLWLAIFAASGVYQQRNLLGGTREYERVFRATTVGMMVVVVAGFLAPPFVIARGWLLLAWLLTFFLTAGGRFWFRRLIYAMRRRGYFLRSTIIVGNNEEGRLVAEQLRLWKTSGLDVIGAVGSPAAHADDLPVLGELDDLEDLVDRYNVAELVLATSALSREQTLQIFEKFGMAERPNLRMSSGLFEIVTTSLDVHEIGFVPLVSINKVRLTGTDRGMKFLLDYALALPGLILLAPFLAMIAVLIKLDSPGPAFHRRRVMGVNGKQFDAYKFRTMKLNGDKLLSGRPELRNELAENHKLKDDPRVTRIGRVLRRFSLDELPQLANVLKREMSLVGPRMIAPDELAKYEKWGLNLLTVHPGITGLWQVSGRSDLSYEDRVRLDMHYVRNWSLWLDLQLLAQTVPAVLRARGAY